mmetsp:Transcript_32434/g.39859  ORF Transcript_32434/g.39859 Transcript_32434/m.39859 type:complete len:304 (+) Transcript_32434:1-912(+)
MRSKQQQQQQQQQHRQQNNNSEQKDQKPNLPKVKGSGAPKKPLKRLQLHERNISIASYSAFLPPLKEETQQNRSFASTSKSNDELQRDGSNSKEIVTDNHNLITTPQQNQPEDNDHIHKQEINIPEKMAPNPIPLVIVNRKHSLSMDFSCITEDTHMRRFISDPHRLDGCRSNRPDVNSPQWTATRKDANDSPPSRAFENIDILKLHAPKLVHEPPTTVNRHFTNDSNGTGADKKLLKNATGDFIADLNGDDAAAGKNVPSIIVSINKKDDYSCITEDSFPMSSPREKTTAPIIQELIHHPVQ